MAGRLTEDRKLAKVQKTFYLNEELSRLLDAIADSTGASFTKIVTAALVKYLFDEFPKPDPEWMRIAVALERGDLSLPQCFLRVMRWCEKNESLKRDELTIIREELPEDKRESSRLNLLEVRTHFPSQILRHWAAALDEAEDPLGLLIIKLTEREVTGSEAD